MSAVHLQPLNKITSGRPQQTPHLNEQIRTASRMSHAEPVRRRKRRKTKLLCRYWTIKFLSSRRSKLTTSGPWIQVIPQVRLRDVSIQIDEQDALVAVWAVGTKGDVLYRHGVTGECPQVHSFNSSYFVPAIWKRGVARRQGGVFNTTEMWRKRPVERLCFKWPAARFIPSKSWIYLSKNKENFWLNNCPLLETAFEQIEKIDLLRNNCKSPVEN